LQEMAKIPFRSKLCLRIQSKEVLIFFKGEKR
jgi:hypothetical protein